MKRLNIDLKPEEHENLKVSATRKGKTITKLVRQRIAKDIAPETKTTPR